MGARLLMLQEAVTERPALRLVPRAAAPPEVEPSLSFAELRDRARRLAEAGRFEEALADLDAALELARRGQSPELVDLAVCNRSAILAVLGRHREVMAPLREILLRSADGECCFAASYWLSCALERDKSFKKGLFYAQIARDRALQLGALELLARSYNQVGNCLLADSHFERARQDYEMALTLLPAAATADRCTVSSNLGYCRMMLGEVREGMALSLGALRGFKRLGAHAYTVWPHLDLCYGYLELGRLDRARWHVERAHELARSMGYVGELKIALFLLGEVELAAGDSERAFGYFHQLQRRFYPEAGRTAELMAAVSMRRVVNLRA